MLEACDYIFDTLDEANAYARHLNNLADKDDKLKKSQDKIRAYQDSSHSKIGQDKLDKIYDKRHRLYYSDTDGYGNSRVGFKYDLANKDESIRNRINEDRDRAKNDNHYRKLEHNYKKSWMEKHGDTGTDNLKQKEPGSVKKIQDEYRNEKKKAIKETCLAILSIIDEL